MELQDVFLLLGGLALFLYGMNTMCANLEVAAGDRLHQPYRLPLIPGGEATFADCQELGAMAVYISGAGSTLMAVVGEEPTPFCRRLRQRLDQDGRARWEIRPMQIENRGAFLLKEGEAAPKEADR